MAGPLVDNVKKNVEEYVNDLLGKKGRTDYAGFRAMQAAYALNIANSTMSDASKDIAFHAIARSIDGGNTGFFGRSKLRGFLTQSKSKALQLDEQKLAQYKIEDLMQFFGKTDSQNIK